MEVTLRFVPHHEIERYLREGWVVTNDLADGEFGALMLRPCNCRIHAAGW
jgi:hypothetical protein